MKRNSWQEYQKDVADDNYYYLRSCIRQNFFPGSEKAFIRILRQELGRDIYDDPAHTSCTGIGYHSDVVPHETIMTVVARQFALAAEAGYENLAVSCITSFGVYTETLETWREFPEVEERVRENLYKATGRELRKPKNVSHASDIIFHHREAIRQRAKYPLVNRMPLRQNIPEGGHRRGGVSLCAGRYDRVVGRTGRGLSGAAPLLRFRFP